MNRVPNTSTLMRTFKQLVKSARSNEGWEEMLDGDVMKVWFKDAPVLTISEEQMCCMKGELIVPISPEEAFNTVTQLEKRLKWDLMYKTGKVIEEIDKNDCRVLHMFGKMTDSSTHSSNKVDKASKNNIDYCILQCVSSTQANNQMLALTSAENNNQDELIYYIISEHSTKHAEVPKKDESVRGQVFPPSGFVISGRGFLSSDSNTKENQHHMEDQPKEKKPNITTRQLEGDNDNKKIPFTKIVYIMRQLGNEAIGASRESQWEVFMQSLVKLRKALSGSSITQETND